MKYEEEIRGQTWLGRHHPAMTWLEEHAKEFKGIHPIRALVVGIGGGEEIRRVRQRWITGKSGLHTPTEHVEVAWALHLAGVPFEVTALDVNPNAVRLAKKHLEERIIRIHEQINTLEQVPHIWKGVWRRRLDYLERFGLKPSTSEGRHEFEVPKEIAGHIRLRGPDSKGDVLKTELKSEHQIITCFNVGIYHGQEDQRHLARILFEALEDGGVLLTNDRGEQGAFLEALRHRMPEPAEIGLVPHFDPSRKEKILAFQKAA